MAHITYPIGDVTTVVLHPICDVTTVKTLVKVLVAFSTLKVMNYD